MRQWCKHRAVVLNKIRQTEQSERRPKPNEMSRFTAETPITLMAASSTRVALAYGPTPGKAPQKTAHAYT